MTSTVEPPTRVHPITRFASRAREVIEDLAGCPVWSMSVEEKAASLCDLAAAAAQLEELRLRVLLAGDRDGIGELDASPSTAVWYARATRTTRSAAGRDVKLARCLDTEFEATRAAFAAGAVNREQAEVVVAALRDLAKAAAAFEAHRVAHPEPGLFPDEVAGLPQLPADLLARAEAALLAEAASQDAQALRVLGRHLLEVVAPEVAEEALGRKLDEQERAAAARMRLVVRDNGDGTHSGSFTVPDLHAAMLEAALEALCSPRVTKPGEPGHHTDGDGQRVPRPERRGQAFCVFLERYPVQRLPQTAGVAASVVVTIDWAALRAWYATAGLDTGGRISAGEARRLLCSAGILPAVLGGNSEVLDLGREQRFFSRAQRRAKNLAFPVCQVPGCDRLPEAHHHRPWAQGGRTDLADLVNLCPWHHHRAHDPRYELRLSPGGDATFHRRT